MLSSTWILVLWPIGASAGALQTSTDIAVPTSGTTITLKIEINALPGVVTGDARVTNAATTTPTAATSVTAFNKVACTPNTICRDAITCGIRYGGCYDENFCAGTTSYPVPTTKCNPARDLTSNRRLSPDFVDREVMSARLTAT